MTLKMLIETGMLSTPRMAVPGSGPTVRVDPSGDTAGREARPAVVTDLTEVLNTTRTGRVMLYPGVYHLSGDVVIDGAQGLTICSAIKGAQPHIVVDPGAAIGLEIRNSRDVTLEGLLIDGSASRAGIATVQFTHSAGHVRETTLLGGLHSYRAITVDNIGGARLVTVHVRDCQLRGYVGAGIYASGPVRLNVTAALFDASDAGRVSARTALGVVFNGMTSDAVTAGGSVSHSTFRNHFQAIEAIETGGVIVSHNTLMDNVVGIAIETAGVFHPMVSGNKVIDNIIRDIPNGGAGIFIFDNGDPARSALLNTVISRNIITAAFPGATGFGIQASANAPADTALTATISGNSLIHFAPRDAILNFNNYAGLTLYNNTVIP